jgi:hypothetical protein
MRKIIILFILTALGHFSIFGQDSRSIGNSPQSKNYFLFSAKQVAAVLAAYQKHPYTLYYDNLIVEYEKRMKDNAHKYKVMARKMRKPQYSDPSYFGHKRKPKKRPVGKRKYCKECEIVH